jgi:hypothetical protein
MLVFDTHHCLVSSQASSYTTPLHCLHIIDIPSKIWQPKPESKYVLLDYDNDVNNTLFMSTQYSQYFCCVPAAFASSHTNVCLWDSNTAKFLCISTNIDLTT